jgi:hypothetical protein
MGQEARAEEENAKMPNSWMALEGDQENAHNSGLRRAWLNLLRPPGGLVAWPFDGEVRCRGSGTEWHQRQRLASQFDTTAHPSMLINLVLV